MGGVELNLIRAEGDLELGVRELSFGCSEFDDKPINSEATIVVRRRNKEERLHRPQMMLSPATDSILVH